MGSALERFEIFITKKGPVLVTGDSRIEIVNSLLRHYDYGRTMIELCNITSDTALPKSSVFNTLEGLVENGILKRTERNGKKGYAFDSYRILGSRTFTEDQLSSINETVSNIMRTTPFPRMIIQYIAALSFLYRLDLVPVMKTTGHDFGVWICANSDSLDEALVLIRKCYSTLNVAQIDIKSEPLSKIVVTFDNPYVKDEMARVLGTFIVSSICSVFNGYCEDSCVIYDYNVIGTALTADLIKCNDGYDIEIIPSDFSFDNDANNNFMMFISSDGTMRSVSNPLGLAVLKVMKPGKPISSSEITASLAGDNKKPQSSVLFYLDKMTKTGLVTTAMVDGKKKYVRLASELFDWDSSMEPVYDSDRIPSNLLLNEGEAFMELLVGFIRRLESLKIVTSQVTATLAKLVAYDALANSDAKSIETAIDRIKEYSGWFSFSSLNIISFSPFVIVRQYDESISTEMKTSILSFDSSFFKTILSNVTGADYEFDYEDFSIGDRKGYKLTYRIIRNDLKK